MSPPPLSAFSPGDRAPQSELWVLHDTITASQISRLLDALPTMVLILTRLRQTVYANQALLDRLGYSDRKALVGLRPGEVFGCAHAHQPPGGCGTTEFCRYCGGVRAILESHAGKASVQECRIEKGSGLESLDLRVRAEPVEVEGGAFTLYAIDDVGHEKRRQALERIFFHDVLNTAGGLRGMAEMLTTAKESEYKELVGVVSELAERLVDEINAQRELANAESGELHVQLAVVNSLQVVRSVCAGCQGHPVAKDRRIVVEPDAASRDIVTDRTLVSRVLGNLVKNAVEATARGGEVRVSCDADPDGVIFRVWNEAVMPREVQVQMFQRSFSTKGRGRGLGCYSIKLLTETYLKGLVRFISAPDQGTTFYVRLPVRPGDEI